MINWGSVPAGSVLPFPFTTYGKTNGESITLTGLAVTDIEVYKGTSMTQRSSDNGYALMDTDGIDIDGVTGFHGFSIDTSDNTDAGFYSAGSFYTVLVSTITVDGQTVSFIAGTFRLVAAENTAGTPAVDAVRLGGAAQTGRDVGASVLLSNGTGAGQVKLSGGYVAPNWGDVGNPTTVVGLTGTTIKTATDVETDTADIQSRIPAALVGGRMDASVGAMANNVMTAAAAAADLTTELQNGLATAAALADVQTDTNDIQARLPAALTADGNIKADTLRVGGTLQTAGDLAAMVETIDNFLDTEIAAILGDTGTDIPAQIAALNNLSAAQVNAEVVDALATDTYAEPSGTPAATIALTAKIGWLYMALRNKLEVTSSAKTFYDDGGAAEWKKTLSDDGVTYSETEATTP